MAQELGDNEVYVVIPGNYVGKRKKSTTVTAVNEMGNSSFLFEIVINKNERRRLIGQHASIRKSDELYVRKPVIPCG